MNALRIGDPAPDFTIDTTTDATLHALIKERQTAAVVYFYPLDFSPVCSAQACMIRGIQKGTDGGLSPLIIGVSPQSDRVHSKFRDAKILPQLLVSDRNKAIATSYGAVGLLGMIRRVSYLINPNLRIAGRAFGTLSLAQHQKLVSDYVGSLSDPPDA